MCKRKASSGMHVTLVSHSDVLFVFCMNFFDSISNERIFLCVYDWFYVLPFIVLPSFGR